MVTQPDHYVLRINLVSWTPAKQSSSRAPMPVAPICHDKTRRVSVAVGLTNYFWALPRQRGFRVCMRPNGKRSPAQNATMWVT